MASVSCCSSRVPRRPDFFQCATKSAKSSGRRAKSHAFSRSLFKKRANIVDTPMLCERRDLVALHRQHRNRTYGVFPRLALLSMAELHRFGRFSLNCRHEHLFRFQRDDLCDLVLNRKPALQRCHIQTWTPVAGAGRNEHPGTTEMAGYIPREPPKRPLEPAICELELFHRVEEKPARFTIPSDFQASNFSPADGSSRHVRDSLSRDSMGTEKAWRPSVSRRLACSFISLDLPAPASDRSATLACSRSSSRPKVGPGPHTSRDAKTPGSSNSL